MKLHLESLIHTSFCRLIFLVFFLCQFNILFGQTINCNLPDYSTFCSGSILSIPVTFNGSWNENNKFFLKLKEAEWSGDTTIIIEANNYSSPLQFQIPVVFASRLKNRGKYFKLTIESTSPIAVSNQLISIMSLLPTAQLGFPIQSSGLFEINEYVNPGIAKSITTSLYSGNQSGSSAIILNDSLTFFSGQSLFVRPTSKKNYFITKVYNSCGNGQILPPNLVTVKVNAFKIKITNVSPLLICEDRKFHVSVDYTGNFAPDNQFVIEIASITGDSIRQLPTTILDNKNFTATLDNSYKKGNYLTRLRGTSPDIATNYVPLNIAGSPHITLQAISGAVNPIEYKKEVWHRISISGDYGVIPTGLKLSEGTIIKDFKSSGGDYLCDHHLHPEQSIYYKVDSLVTNCGVIKNFTVTGEKDLIVKKDFYIEDLNKREFCSGEKVRVKIRSDFSFGNNNVFTAKFYKSNSSSILSSPVTQVGDSLEFAFPMESWDLGFKIEASSPSVTSSMYWDQITLLQKPEIISLNASTYIDFPGMTSYYFDLKGHKPVNVTLTDGITESKHEILGQYYINLTPLQTTNYQIKSLENSCGTTAYNPTRNFTIQVGDPNKKVILMTNNLYNTCSGKSYHVEFKTTGTFSETEEYVVILNYIKNFQSYNIEIGRGITSPINITIPSNLTSDGKLSNTYFIIKAVQSGIESAGWYGQSNTIINQNPNINFNQYKTIIPLLPNFYHTNVWQNEVEILNGESVSYLIYDDNTIANQKYKVKINNDWFNVQNGDYSSGFSSILKPKTDTVLVINKSENECGLFPENDSLKINVRKYRINYSIIDGIDKCKGNFIDLVVDVEGKTVNTLNQFKFYIVPEANKSLKFEVPVFQVLSSNTYRIQLPDIPYDGFMTFEILPIQNSELYAKNYKRKQFYLSKTPIVKFTGLDGSSIIWKDPSNTAVKMKIETTNSENLYWTGSIKNFVRPDYGGSMNVYSKNYIHSMNAENGDTFELSGIENYCGYGKSEGRLIVKLCLHNVEYYGYVYYNPTGEVYSDSYIKSNIHKYYGGTTNIKKYSAKNSIELLPGFNSENGQTFTAEIKGCEVVR